jgi:1-acyl-sn-glycerol-3-phosphate acyltransferase
LAGGSTSSSTGGQKILSIDNTSVAGRVLPHPATPKIEDKYPMKRGLVGKLAYGIGITVARLSIILRAEGLENIPASIPYVIAANHETYVDGMLIGSYLPKKHFKVLSCIAAQDLGDKHGLLGRLILRVGRAIPIDRFGNPVRGLIIAKKKVDEGNILLVHPEGTRSIDGRLGELKDGAAYIAIKSRVPLLPVFLDGAYEVFSRHMQYPQGHNPLTRQRREVILTFGKPFDPADFGNARELTAALTDWMQARFREKKISRVFRTVNQ